MLYEIERFIELSNQRKEKFLVVNNIIFKLYQKMIIPFGPVKQDFSIGKKEAKHLLSSMSGLLVRYTNGINKSQISNWYAVICNTFTPLDKLKSKQRSEIYRGLKNCTVERIDAETMSQYGYDVFIAAQERYKSSKVLIPKKEIFERNVLATKSFGDIIHYWGVYNNNKLIAYSSNYIFGKTEAQYTTMKFHPDFMHLYPAYTLIHTMNEYYLQKQNFEYVNDGFRSILHETNIQDFLIRKFNFYKSYTKLNIYYSFPLKTLMPLVFPFKSLFAKFDPRFSALFELEKIRRNSYE
jgi:hypothetical protein